MPTRRDTLRIIPGGFLLAGAAGGVVASTKGVMF
jgi:hypothetical protein